VTVHELIVTPRALSGFKQSMGEPPPCWESHGATTKISASAMKVGLADKSRYGRGAVGRLRMSYPLGVLRLSIDVKITWMYKMSQ
jgi:hypothetical protein